MCVPSGSTIKSPRFVHTVYLYVSYDSYSTLCLFSNSVYWFVFLIEAHCDHCTVQTKSLCIIQINFSLQALVDWYWQGTSEVLGQKPVLVPLHPLHISHGLAWDWTWASCGEKVWLISTWTMAFHQHSIFVFISILLLPQGQRNKTYELQKLGSSG